MNSIVGVRPLADTPRIAPLASTVSTVHATPSNGRSSFAFIVTVDPLAVIVSVSPSTATVGFDVSTAASHVSWSPRPGVAHAISVCAIGGTTSTSPSSDHVPDSVLQPAFAEMLAPSKVTSTCVPGTSVKPCTPVATNVPLSESVTVVVVVDVDDNDDLVAAVVVVAPAAVVVAPAALVVVAAAVVVTSPRSALSSPHTTSSKSAPAPTSSFLMPRDARGRVCSHRGIRRRHRCVGQNGVSMTQASGPATSTIASATASTIT